MNSPANNYGLFQKKKRIAKSEIIRGYNSYTDVIKSSKIKISGRIKVLYKFGKSESTEIFSSPQIIFSTKVGFLISKKLFSKAVTRNKIRRQLKESYRILKGKYTEKNKPQFNLALIFSLSRSGNDYVKKHSRLDFKETKKDMDTLLDKIFKEAKRYI